MTSGHKWKPLQRAVAKPASETLIEVWMKHFGCDRAEALERMADEQKRVELWRNDLYQVEVRRDPANESVHLNIRRVDGYPGRDWRHFQQIKNELVGAECEAVELYPAESRLTDTSNKYHLYCCTDPTFRFPFGFETRDVQFGNESDGGLRQRPPMKYVDSKVELAGAGFRCEGCGCTVLCNPDRDDPQITQRLCSSCFVPHMRHTA